MTMLIGGLATALLTYGCHSFVACAIALVAARWLRRPQDRDIVWKAALVAPVLTATTTTLLSSFGGTVPFVDLAEVARRAVHVHLPARRMIVRVLLTPNGRDVFRRVDDPVAVALSAIAIGVAGCCIALATIRFARRRLALARALRPRRVVSTSLRSADYRAVELSVADELQSPVAFGGAKICLPANVLSDFASDHRDALVAHELAHIERRDPRWLCVAEVITTLSAFQPLSFVLARAFRRDIELICDEAALRRTNDRRALIGALALLAAPFDPRSPLSGAATAYDGSPLVARAQRIASVSLESTSRHRGAAFFAVAGLVALLFAIPVVSAAARFSDVPIDPLRAARRLQAAGRMVTIDSTVVGHRRRVMVVVE